MGLVGKKLLLASGKKVFVQDKIRAGNEDAFIAETEGGELRLLRMFEADGFGINGAKILPGDDQA